MDVNRVNHVIKIAASNTAYYSITPGLDVKKPLYAPVFAPTFLPLPFYVGMLFQILMTGPPGGLQTDKGKKRTTSTHKSVQNNDTIQNKKEKVLYNTQVTTPCMYACTELALQ